MTTQHNNTTRVCDPKAGRREPTENTEDLPLFSLSHYANILKQNGNAETTIYTVIKKLERMAKITDLNNPYEVKETLANLKWKNTSKNKFINIYSRYLKYIGKKWNEPKYKPQNEIPFIPTEQEINLLIASAGKKMKAYLQFLKETATRAGEASTTQWQDIDTERMTIYIHAEKGSNDRILPISHKLLNMLNTLPHKNEKIFKTSHGLRTNFEKLRTRIANSLSQPRLKKIHFHTFRHWKATTEYHKTKDIIHVKNFLGHKDITSTMIYIHIESAIYLKDTDEWTCKIAHNQNEAIKLIESGFEYITEIDGAKLFRKRK